MSWLARWRSLATSMPDIRVRGDKERLGQHHLSGIERAGPEVKTGMQDHGYYQTGSLEAGVAFRRGVWMAGQTSGHSWRVAVRPQTVTKTRMMAAFPPGLQGPWENNVSCRTLQESASP